MPVLTLPIHVLTDAPVFAVPGAGLLTNAPTPVLPGTATPGSVVQVFDNRNADGSARADPVTGAFAVALTTATPGIQQITASSAGPGIYSSLTSATVPLFELPAAVNGVSSTDLATVDVACVLGRGFALQFTSGTEAVQFLDGTLSVGPDTDAAYVARLYQGLFGAVPDSGNLSVWTNYLAAGHSQTDVAAGFLAAPAAAPLAALSDAQYVQQVFAGLLGHAPTDAQLGAFTGVLANGASRAAVLAGIAGSPEAKSALAPQTSRLFVTDTATQTANDLFRVGLGHDATQAVVQSLGASLRAELTAPQLAREIASTPEFLGLHGGQSDSSYVTNLYTAGLGRAPTGPELSVDVGNLQSGVFDRSTLLTTVATSPEGIAHLTQPL